MIFLSGQLGIGQMGLSLIGPCFMELPGDGVVPLLTGLGVEELRNASERLGALEGGGAASTKVRMAVQEEIDLKRWNESISLQAKNLARWRSQIGSSENGSVERRLWQGDLVYKNLLQGKYRYILGSLAQLSMKVVHRNSAAFAREKAEKLWQVLVLDFRWVDINQTTQVGVLRVEVHEDIKPAVQRAYTFWSKYLPELKKFGEKEKMFTNVSEFLERRRVFLEVEMGIVTEETDKIEPLDATNELLAELMEEAGNNQLRVVNRLREMERDGILRRALGPSAVKKRIMTAKVGDPLCRFKGVHTKRTDVSDSLLKKVLMDNRRSFTAAARALESMGLPISYQTIAKRYYAQLEK